MKRIAAAGAALAAAVGLAVGGLFAWAAGSTDHSLLARALIWSDSDTGDIDRFPARAVRASGPEMVLSKAGTSPFDGLVIGEGTPFSDFLHETDTTAFIALAGNEVIYEGYFNGGGHNEPSTSMSMAKSLVSTLVGIAIDEGYLGGVDDPVTRYVPELLERDPRFGDITLRHLLTMRSGIRFEGWTSPWDDPTRTYYATDLRSTALENTVVVEPPGSRFTYNDYNPLLLGMVLERATGMTVSEYASTRLWGPMGAQADASWSLDSASSGYEKMSTGFNAHPMDYARFGRLILDGGRRGDLEIVPEAWIDEATREGAGTEAGGYGYSWWIDAEHGGFDAEGDYCQFVYLHPRTDLVLVRLGRSCGGVYWTGLLGDLAEWFGHQEAS